MISMNLFWSMFTLLLHLFDRYALYALVNYLKDVLVNYFIEHTTLIASSWTKIISALE